jgi:hypothetical protein
LHYKLLVLPTLLLDFDVVKKEKAEQAMSTEAPRRKDQDFAAASLTA